MPISLLHTQQGVIRQHRPKIYQQINGQRKAIAGAYVLLGKQEVGFQIAAYDRSEQLVIDPVLSYSTYLGGSDLENGIGITVDGQGNAYATGLTQSTDFPTQNALNSNLVGLFDAFIAKIEVSASNEASLVYSTYIGGSSYDVPQAIAVDRQGNAYITGYTQSDDFPTQNAFDSNLSGETDAFVTKLNAKGNGLLYSTYLGSGSFEDGNGIAVDARGNIYVVGRTGSTDFPTKNGFSSNLSSSYDAFVTKLNPTRVGAASLLYSTYLGGDGVDTGKAIAVDLRGNAYVTGDTQSTDFPTKNAFSSTFDGQDIFVTKLNTAASGKTSLLYSTSLGGEPIGTVIYGDFGNGIAVDLRGVVYVTGQTCSPNFPTKNAFSSNLSGVCDAFVTKLAPAASGETSLLYSSYLGGSGDDSGNGIAVDWRGNAYITGYTQSANFPTKNAFDSTFDGSFDAFVVKVDPLAADEASLVYSSYLGGSNNDFGAEIAVDQQGNAYVTGATLSTNFLTKNAFDPTFSGGDDAFVTKISR